MKRRKILLLGILIGANVFFTGCKKSYSCKCVTEYYDTDGTSLGFEDEEPISIESKSKAEASNTCNGYDQESDGISSVCTIN